MYSSAGRADRRRADAHAVDQHQHLLGVGAAHEQRGELAGAAVVDDVDTGFAAQHIGDVGARLRSISSRSI